MTLDTVKDSKRKGTSVNNEDREVMGENKKRKYSHLKLSKNSSRNLTRSIRSRSRKCESYMDVFVRANDNDEELIKLNTIDIKSLKDGFKYLGYRCRVVVSRQRIKESTNNLPTAFNWVEGIIKYWDPKFKLFFIHFLLSPSINSFKNPNNIPKHEWKYLSTQNNSPPANADLCNLLLSPFAIDRGWFDPNPVTIRIYGDSPVLDLPSILVKNKLEKIACKELTNGVCTRCNLPFVNEETSRSCDACSRKFHLKCTTENISSIQDLNDFGTTTLMQFNSPNSSELLEIANEHNQYIRERRRVWKRNVNSVDGNSNLNNKLFHDNQLPYDLVDVEELERVLPTQVKAIILDNYNLSHTNIRKLLSKLPNKTGSIIGDHQIKLLCRNYRYNKRNKSTMLANSFEEGKYSSKNTLESSPSKVSSDRKNLKKNNLMTEINSNLELNKSESSLESSVTEVNHLIQSDLKPDNTSIQYLENVKMADDQIQESQRKYKCKDCIPCIYCSEPLLRIPLILKPSELPNRSVVYSQIPTKLESFVICSICGTCYHGSCGNSFVPPLIFGGNNFKCSNCCKCVHCGYRDDGFMDYASWDSTFTSCIRCCKGFERGQFCSICRKIWTSSWEGEWLQCDICKFWAHYDCDKDLNKPIEFYSNINNAYNCPACRSNDNSVKYQRIIDHFICLDKNKDFVSIPLPSYQNYWKVVKVPMDVITITKNLENKKYESDEFLFIKDIFRIIYNAQISHMPNHRIFKLAANILKKIAHLFKLLFGENILLNFFKTIKGDDSSMLILMDQINANSSFRGKMREELVENTNSNTSLEQYPAYIINNTNENNFESELIVLTDYILSRIELNSEVNDKLRKTVTMKPFIYFRRFDFLNSTFEELMLEFEKCVICKQKSDNIIRCKKCGVGVHFECSEQVNDSFICNLCTECNICFELIADIDTPIIFCTACGKRAHYTCIWQDSENLANKFKDSNQFPSKANKRNQAKCTSCFSGILKDNKDYICLWKIFSSASSPNKSMALINSPFTAVFGKGYYQHLINEIYLCMDCFKRKECSDSNLFMQTYITEYNILFEKLQNFQKLLHEIINSSERNLCLEIREEYMFKTLDIISRTKLKPLNTSCKQENIIICNICSDHFRCKDFNDLVDIANDTSICSVSLNFICKSCSHLKHENSKNQGDINELNSTQNADSNVLTNLGLNNSLKNFPSILNTLISASQFRVTLSGDIIMLLRVILTPFLDQTISEFIGRQTSYSDVNLDKMKNEIFINYLNSEFFAEEIKHSSYSSLLQWYMFYIHQNGSFDFSNMRREYLQHFYKQNVNLSSLIQNNTLSIIINSIEKMVISNEVNNTINQNRLIQYSLNDPDYLLFLGFYSNLLFIPENLHIFGLENLNTIHFQAVVDTKMYLDIHNSFENYISSNNQSLKKNSASASKQRTLRNEIAQGLTLIKKQIERDNSNYREFLDVSFFVLIYKLILEYLSEPDNHLDNIDFNKCKYCGRRGNILLGEQLINVEKNVNIHKECVLWSLPFVLEPILNNLDMGYESKFETSKKRCEVYSSKYPNFGSILWPMVRRPIRVDINDIIITLNDLKVLKCFFCGQVGATIKCSGNDTCFKYYHIDCIFKHVNIGYNFNWIFNEPNDNNIIHSNLANSSSAGTSVHIRIKYRRVWCDECWETYKTLVEPEPNFSEGLTGGILNIFVRMLSVNIIVVNTKIQAVMKTTNNHKSVELFLEELISIINFKKKSNSKLKILIQKLKRIRDSISHHPILEPCILNDSIIFLDPGKILEGNIINQGAFSPTNYKALRVWKSSKIINSRFNIDNCLSLYLCSVSENDGDNVFQIDWIPSSMNQVKKVSELLSTQDLRSIELSTEVFVNGIAHKLFGIPLLRGLNLMDLFNSFLDLLSAESFENLSHSTLKSLVYPSYLFNNPLVHLNTQGSQVRSESDAQSQMFFGFREEFIYNFIKCKTDTFFLFKLISELNTKKIFSETMHPELWLTHRQYPYSEKLTKYEGFDFEYRKLGRNETRGSRVKEDLFNVLYTGNNKDPDNVELMSSVQIFQESSRRIKAKLEDMAPSKLYRYLDSLPYDKRLSIKKSSIHGFGLFAKEFIRAGEPIIEYVGELIRNSVADKRETLYKSDGNRDGSCYMFRLDESSVIDATNIGNHARFMNHCCDPNSICKVISVDSHKHIVIFSKKNINKDEEITYDYQFNVEEASEKITCHCGASNCLGRMN